MIIIFEAGPTHNGLESARNLTKFARNSGADAIKFQMVDPDRLVADRNQLFSYETYDGPVSEPLYDILVRRSLKKDEWIELINYSKSLGLKFYCTATFEDEIDFLQKAGCNAIKIASSDINHYPLLRHAAQSGMEVHIDTGNSTLGEVEKAVDVLVKEGNENITIHHCPSGYPVKVDNVNLRVIQTLKQMFPYKIAFSDHSPGYEMDIAAVALGVDAVEKTITLDKKTPSVEHVMSLEPDEMIHFVKVIRDVEKALGSNRKTGGELATRRSAYITKPVKAGQKLSEAPIEFRRPGYGISPDHFEALKDHVFKTDLPEKILEHGDFQ